MFSWLYNWYYYTDEEYSRALDQIKFFENKINEVYSKTDLSQEDKQKRIARLRQVIESIKYTFSIY